ncbi:sugar ABC transporter substrate-binding protein [Lachnospiraceae bacterium ASD3451]|uniref:sugar ABC transporter substrate-binding protein n=1 Tax=Diplocloster agilis TaxID=2850323 RepID=UPI001D679327|nr:sugar ABC transporter substrate-binding protein [Diplocloster agilis]MBU9746807.1 sugar ABC transporter substrate-binding protein [Diplocloster agilis]
MKKTLCLFLTLILSISILSGCGQDTQEASGDTNQPTETTASKPAADAESDSSQNAAPAENSSFTPAADIELPLGKKAYALPVDQAAEKPVRLAAIGLELNEFSLLVKDGILWASDALKDRNCQVDFVALTEFNTVKVEEAIRDCITMGYDGIATFGFSETLQPVIQDAVDAGIVVTTWNTDAGEDSARMGFFGEDGYAGANRLGTYAREVIGEDGGEYAVITGSFSVYSHEQRRNGFKDALKDNAKFECVAETENDDKTDLSYDQASNAILAYPDLKFIYVSAGGPEGAAKAILDAGKTGQVKLFCHDRTAETVRYTKSGEIYGCLDQDPFNQGAAPLICTYNYLVAGEPIQDVNYFSGEILTPDNVNEFYPD